MRVPRPTGATWRGAALAAAVLTAVAAGACADGDGDAARRERPTASPITSGTGSTAAPAPPAGTATAGRAPATAPGGAPTLLDLVARDERLDAVYRALRDRPLGRRLDDPGRRSTFFAPVDAAVGGVPPAALHDRLRAQVVRGRVTAADLASGPTLRSVAGTPLPVAVGAGGATVGGAALRTTDVEAANGFLHVVAGLADAAGPVRRRAGGSSPRG